MHTLQEILKFRDSAQFRAVVDRIALKIADIPWQVTPEDAGVARAIAHQPEMPYTNFIRRALLDMLALNFATFEVAVTEKDKFLLMQCFPAELYPVKGWTKDSSRDAFRWMYFNQKDNIEVYLSDQKIAIFPSYGNFDITAEEMTGLPSPVNQVMEAIALKLGIKPEGRSQYPEMAGFTHIFDASLTLQNALNGMPEPEPGYTSLWRNQFGTQATMRLSSGILLPPERQLILGKGNGISAQGYSDWLVESTLRVLLHIYRPLLKGGEQEGAVRSAIGSCNGFEDMIAAIALIFAQGINRLMKNLDIECKFGFIGVPPSDRQALRQLEYQAALSHLGESGADI